LRPHQHEGVEKTVKTLIDHDRATVVMACGTGKTAVGCEIAAQCLPEDGRVLLGVPNRDLVRQGLMEHQLGSRPLGQVIAVCSDQRAVEGISADLTGFDAEVTTDPHLLAMLLRRPGPATVACTYHSWRVIRDAHALYGVAPWNMAIADEAHRLAGAREKDWLPFHANSAIPAERRVYETATPRVYDAEGDAMVSMDDQSVFGPVSYHLPFGEAIARGLLADYRVAICVISNEEVLGLLRSPDGRGFLQTGRNAVDPTVLAEQIALLRVSHQYGARRVLTFHERVADARYFSHTLPDVLDLLEPEQRPERLTSLHINGTMNSSVRREILARLGPQEPGTVVVTNSHLLNEGVDAPEVDAVGFLAGRDPEGTVQAVGRAVRLGGQPGKVATIYIPLVLGPGEDPRSALADSRFATVANALWALRAHDERLANYLDATRVEMGRSAENSRQPRWTVPDWLRVTGAQVSEDFVRAIGLRIVQATSPSWEEWFGHASARYAETGALEVRKSEGPFYRWYNDNRVVYRKGDMPPQTMQRLEKIGMVWSTDPVDRWIAAAAKHYAIYQNLRVSKGTRWGTLDAVSVLANLRRAKRAERLTDAQIAQAEAVGMVWEPEDEALRQRFEQGYPAACSFHRARGAFTPPRGTIWEGVELHRWLSEAVGARREDLHASVINAARRAVGLKPVHCRVRVSAPMLAKLDALGVQLAPARLADQAQALFLSEMAAVRERAARTTKDLATSLGLRGAAQLSQWEHGMCLLGMHQVEAWAEQLKCELLILEQDGTLLATWTAADASTIVNAVHALHKRGGTEPAAPTDRLGSGENIPARMQLQEGRTGYHLHDLLNYLLAAGCRMTPSPRPQAPTVPGANS
jgi:superfamily II DNA or RNA helicase